MNLAFYYHIPISVRNNELFLPGHFGIFIDELAKNVDELILFMHAAKPSEDKFNDYQLKSNNIHFIDLGITTAAWHRIIFHRFFFHKHIELLNSCDAFLVRMPCAFAPFMRMYISDPTKLWFMVVGDYKDGAKHWTVKSIRDWAIKHYLRINDYLFERHLKQYNLLVNSSGLYQKYKNKSNKLFQIKTTTLTSKDFYAKEACLLNKTRARLLYVGRIDRAKGLFELVEAVVKLRNNGINASLKIVGWELKTDSEVTNQLKSFAKKLNVNDQIFFTGKLNIGEELNSVYRDADIFVLPSYYEGFPRVIWESMANSLPVITTPVGGIPDELTHEVNALFVSPKNVTEIKEAVERLIQDKSLRETLVKNGHKKAETNTLETQTKLLIEFIKKA